MKDYIIDKSEFSPSSMWNVSNALHLMKLSYAVYAGTTDNIGATENWTTTEQLVTDAGYQMQKFDGLPISRDFGQTLFKIPLHRLNSNSQSRQSHKTPQFRYKFKVLNSTFILPILILRGSP